MVLTRIHMHVLALAAGIISATAAQAQNGCSPASATVSYNCLYSNYSVGINTSPGSLYTWYFNGTKKAGPVAGDGGAISFPFALQSAADAGQYTVEEVDSGNVTCVYNEIVVINESVTNLHTTSVTGNSVTFTWSGKGKFLYFLNRDANVPTNPVTQQATAALSDASVTVNNLSGNTSYYIYVRSECDGEWTSIPFTTSAGACALFVTHSLLLGAGVHCLGSNVNLTVTNTVSDQTYTWLRDGVPVYGPISGNGDQLSYNMLFNAASQAGTYSVLVSKSGCASTTIGNAVITAAGPVNSISAEYVSEVGAKFIWSPPYQGFSQGYQYAVTTSPAVPTSPGYIGSVTQVVVTQLTPGTNYYFHVRPYCANPTAGWSSVAFTTGTIAPINCAATTTLTECVTTTAVIDPGAGPWDMNGAYPYNSTGSSTPGKEKLYYFTPVTTGVYYIDMIQRVSGTYISYLYKQAGGNCVNTGWTGIRTISEPGKYAIGMLQAGTTYQILLDAPYTDGVAQTFRICRAPVTSTNFNSCQSLSYYVEMSPREEFLLDNNGNLVASIDFSESNKAEFSSSQVYVNNSAIRRDINNREYLDKNYYFNVRRAKIKLFFTNAELQRLIDEPNDGTADVSSISDLKASVMTMVCGNSLGSITSGKLLGQIANGAYDAHSSYIVLETADVSGTLFLHGGNNLLNSSCTAAKTMPFAEGFNINATLPSCWQESKAGSEVSVRQAADTTMSAIEGSGFLFYRSSIFNVGTSTSVSLPRITTISTGVMSFYWYNSNNPSNTLSTEGMRIEYSTNNVSFTTLAFVQRHDGSLAPNTGQWNKIKINLPPGALNQASLYVRLVFVSQKGDDCAMDNFRIEPPAACAEAPGLVVNNMGANFAQVNWGQLGSITRYRCELYNMKEQIIVSNPAIITGTTTTYSNLSPGTTYQFKIRPECSNGVYGEEKILLFTTPGSCPGSLVRFVSPHALTGNFFFWEVNMGNGYQDVVDNGVYSGANTSTLTINTSSPAYVNYAYRCRAYVNFSTIYSQAFNYSFETTWTGATGTAWDQTANWRCGIIPDSNTNVIIPAGLANYPLISTNTATVRKLTVRKNATVTIANGFKLTIAGGH